MASDRAGHTFSFFGMPWSVVVLQKECNLTDEQIEQYRKAMHKGTTMQFVAYYLAVGTDRFVKGPKRWWCGSSWPAT